MFFKIVLTKNLTLFPVEGLVYLTTQTLWYQRLQRFSSKYEFKGFINQTTIHFVSSCNVSYEFVQIILNQCFEQSFFKDKPNASTGIQIAYIIWFRSCIQSNFVHLNSIFYQNSH